MRKFLINKFLFSKFLFILFFTFLFFIFLLPCTFPSPYLAADSQPADVEQYVSPWVLNPGETVVTGLFRGNTENAIILGSGEETRPHPCSSELVTALMGRKSGFLLSGPDEFPSGECVELFLNSHGLVRAMRNKAPLIPSVQAYSLNSSGEDAAISPRGDFYTVFTPLRGLWVHPVSCQAPANPREPRRLGPLPVAAWNSHGQIAAASDSHLIIYDPSADILKRFSLPCNQAGMRLIARDIAWSPSGDRLLLSCLLDYPDRCSDVVLLLVFDSRGREVAHHYAPYISDALWLDERSILYIQSEDPEGSSGRGVLWDYAAGETKIYLPEMPGGYRNIAYSPQSGLLAYTIKKGLGEELRIVPQQSIKTANANAFLCTFRFPFPVRNLQWSASGELYYWDEFNNAVCKIDSGEKQSIVVGGYLPARGVGKGLVFFPEEPIAESLPLYYLP